MQEYQYVDNQAALEELCHSFSSAKWLAIDTEFEREKTYYPELCLIQIGNHEKYAVIDPLRIDDLDVLFDLLYQPSIVKVFHAARQDLEIFYHLKGEVPRPLFDTQLAAPLLGYDEQIGYANLVEKMLNIHVDKSQTRTDWKRRPLKPGQLDYAAADVIHLSTLYQQMIEKLEKMNRLSWLEDDLNDLCSAELYAPNPEFMWTRIRAGKKLKGKKLSTLQLLAAWREQCARDKNSPRNWIIRDEAMIDISQLQPLNLSDLKGIKSVNPKFVEKYGDKILPIIESAAQHKTLDWPGKKTHKPLKIKEEAVVDALVAIVRNIAAESNLNPTVLATRKQLEEFFHEPENSILLKGWRGQYMSEALSGFIQGNLSFQIVNKELKIQVI